MVILFTSVVERYLNSLTNCHPLAEQSMNRTNSLWQTVDQLDVFRETFNT